MIWFSNHLSTIQLLFYLSPLQFAYFSRAEKALHGFASYFAKQSEEAQNRALQLIEYQNKRGGHVDFRDIIKPVFEDELTVRVLIDFSVLRSL